MTDTATPAHSLTGGADAELIRLVGGSELQASPMGRYRNDAPRNDKHRFWSVVG